MKLCRFGSPGSEKPGVIVSRNAKELRLDVSSFGEDYDERFFGSSGPERLRTWLSANEGSCSLVADEIRIAPPICRPSKIICVGLNYRAHAAETGSEVPKEPMLFGKATSAMCGSRDPIVIPRGSTKTDWEVELAIVIGARASYVAEDAARSHIAGFVMMNDVSERAFQKERGGQFIKGKSADTFAPFGPYMLTADELANPDDIGLWLDVNGIRHQDGRTSDMIFKVNEVVSYISHFMTLLPGDVISTGTPSGVGAGLKPPRFLTSGDTLRYGVEGLGTCENAVISCD